MTKQRRTPEEKERLIKEFHLSGLSLKEWCKNNEIPASTMTYWLRCRKSETKLRFVEIAPVVPVEPMIHGQENCGDAICITYDSFEVRITSDTDLHLLKDVLKVVKSLNV